MRKCCRQSQTRAVTKFTKPGDCLLAEPCICVVVVVASLKFETKNYIFIDNKNNEMKHGEIVGMRVNIQDRYKISEFVEENLIGIAPKMLKNASQNYKRDLRNCVLPPVFIQVEGYPSKVVIEIDVHPNGPCVMCVGVCSSFN